MILSQNAISTIPLPSSDDMHFATLEHITLSGNPVASWTDIDNINYWVDGGLKSLNCATDSEHGSLFSSIDPRDLRPLLIARFAALQTLNHVPIQPAERRDAELFYLTYVEKTTPSIPQTLRQKYHPRYQQLAQQYGRASGEAFSPQPETLRSKLLTVRVHLSNVPPSSFPPYLNESSSQQNSVDLKLLTTTPLRLLFNKLHRAFGLVRSPTPSQQAPITSVWALLHPTIDPELDTAVELRNRMRPHDAPNAHVERIVYEMDNLDRDLAGYNFHTGDELVLVRTQN